MRKLNDLVWTGASVLVGSIVCIAAGTILVTTVKEAQEELDKCFNNNK